jgi:4-amino-4-deoxy-L-arabinose transferase-like glycosyltransferase
LNPQQSRRLADYLFLLGFCGFFFFFGLAHFGLIGADEPRYAQVAREMLSRHDWITPTLDHRAWLEKPPLYYWQAMLAYAVFGVSDWAARLPSAVDATLMVFAAYFFLRRFHAGFHLDGALMTASLAGVIGFARAASMDMPLAAMFTISLLAWFAWQESQSRRYLAWFYVFLGLATLAKGPVAPFLAAAILAIFAWTARDFRLLRRTLWLPGISLFCVVALPWYIAVQVRNPQFFRVFILQHNLARFGSNLYHHKEPFWFYLPVMLLGLVPWVIFVLAGAAQSVRAWWRSGRPSPGSQNTLPVFLMIWLIVPLIFFSLSQSKLPGYILPALPAGALLVAEYVRGRVAAHERANSALMILHAAAASLPVIPALMIQYIVLQQRLPLGYGTMVSAVLAAVLAITIVLTLRTQMGLSGLRFITLIPVVVVVAAVLRVGGSAINDKLSTRPLAEEIGQVELKPVPLAVFHTSREVEYGLQFYRNQPVSRYELGGIPPGEHLVVGPAGSQKGIARKVPGRRVSYLGDFNAQGLEYFWVGR